MELARLNEALDGGGVPFRVDSVWYSVPPFPPAESGWTYTQCRCQITKAQTRRFSDHRPCAGCCVEPPQLDQLDALHVAHDLRFYTQGQRKRNATQTPNPAGYGNVGSA